LEKSIIAVRAAVDVAMIVSEPLVVDAGSWRNNARETLVRFMGKRQTDKVKHVSTRLTKA
jgi:hypothetical protein